MPDRIATAAILLASAVTIHNVEEMVWLPGFRNPPWLNVRVSPFAFRFAAIGITLLFWGLAAGLAWGVVPTGVLAGFAAVMIFNALAPHLALTVGLRRYHPGLLTAWLLVVPTAVAALRAVLPASTNGGFLAAGSAGAVLLASSVPVLIAAGHAVERRFRRDV